MSAVLLATNVLSQDLKITVNPKGKVGYADLNGNIVIKCQYESAKPFSNGTAIVTKSGKSGIIDSAGNILLPIKYTQISTWSNQLYIIKEGKKVGIADHQGIVVIPAKYSHISKLNSHGKALISLGGTLTTNDKKTYLANAKYGVIDSLGNILITPKYKGLYEFTFNGQNIYPYYEGKRLEYSYHHTDDTLATDCSFLGFSGNGMNILNAGIMDGNGNELLKPGLYYFVMEPKNGMVRYYNVKKKSTICGYHNLSTNAGFQAAKFETPLNGMNYWSHGDFTGDIAPINGTTWSFIDKAGNTIRTGYSSLIHSQATGMWAAKNNEGKWDVFDEKNNNVPLLSGFEEIYFPETEEDKKVFSVCKNGEYGCINLSGDTIVPFKYESITKNRYDMIGVKENGKWGLLTADNVCMIPSEYISIILPDARNAKHIWVKQADSLYYHMNLITNNLSSKGYKAVGNFKDGVAHVAPIDLNVSNTPVNRAQLINPNTSQITTDTIKVEKHIDSFGYILNTEDEEIIDLPVSTLYKDVVVKEIKKYGNKPLNQTAKKNILLEVTKSNRTYDLKSTLSEDEWNY